MSELADSPEPVGASSGRGGAAQLLDRWVTAIENTVIIVCYVALIAIVGIETFRRFAFREQAAWGPEIAMYAFIWLSWFAMSKNIIESKHLAFTAIRQRLPVAVRQALESIDSVLWLIIGAVIIYGSYGVVETNIRFDQTVFGTNIPIAAASIAVPVAWSLAMIRVLQRLYLVLSGREAELHETGAEEIR